MFMAEDKEIFKIRKYLIDIFLHKYKRYNMPVNEDNRFIISLNYDKIVDLEIYVFRKNFFDTENINNIEIHLRCRNIKTDYTDTVFIFIIKENANIYKAVDEVFDNYVTMINTALSLNEIGLLNFI